jgi:hypothetical protein
MGRANGIKQLQPVGIEPRGHGSSPEPGSSADDILYGHLSAPVRPQSGKRSYRNQGVRDGRRVEFWTSEPDITSLDDAQDRDLLHREDGPAFIMYDEQDRVRGEVYQRHGLLHRDDGPAVINYFENGMAQTEQWFYEGREHREDGPAELTYDQLAALKGESVVEDEVWWTHGQLHELLDE